MEEAYLLAHPGGLVRQRLGGREALSTRAEFLGGPSMCVGASDLVEAGRLPCAGGGDVGNDVGDALWIDDLVQRRAGPVDEPTPRTWPLLLVIRR